ncbi:MAG: GNAT family N-acetyltransferase [Ilumatobacter sp.]
MSITPPWNGAILTPTPGPPASGYVRLVLRDLTDTDLDRVLEINQANVPAVGSATRSPLAHLVAQSAIALVSETDGDSTSGISGFCIVFAAGADYDSINYRWFMEHHSTTMYLDRVAFDERFHGRGLGTEMYAEVDRRIRARHPDATGLTLEVNIDPPNEPSLAFHAALGFTEVGRQMSKGIEVSLMHRPLT